MKTYTLTIPLISPHVDMTINVEARTKKEAIKLAKKGLFIGKGKYVVYGYECAEWEEAVVEQIK